METSSEKYKILISRCLSEEISPSEKEELDAWLAESVENQKTYEQLRKIWALEPLSSELYFDKELAFNKISERIEANKGETKVLPFGRKRSLGLYYLSGIAATVLLLIGFYFTFTNKPEPTIIQFAANGPGFETVTLPDNSSVYLKSGSKISFPEDFSGDARAVELHGEAFFEVTHNPEKPFIVSVGETEIRVLGTSFNIAECAKENTTEVAVLTGKVRFSGIYKPDDFVILTKNMKGTFDHSTGLLNSGTYSNPNFLAWKTGLLEFDETPLPEVFRILEKTFDITVKVECNIQGQKLTARFDHESPENIFKSLSLLFGFQVSNTSNLYTIN